jgi:hypothetical protein
MLHSDSSEIYLLTSFISLSLARLPTSSDVEMADEC